MGGGVWVDGYLGMFPTVPSYLHLLGYASMYAGSLGVRPTGLRSCLEGDSSETAPATVIWGQEGSPGQRVYIPVLYMFIRTHQMYMPNFLSCETGTTKSAGVGSRLANMIRITM